jgi:hypothetical protein
MSSPQSLTIPVSVPRTLYARIERVCIAASASRSKLVSRSALFREAALRGLAELEREIGLSAQEGS